VIALDERTVAVGDRSTTKEAAIRRAADLLAGAGLVDPRYADSMLGREEVANTYLGSGIAIPHGLGSDRSLIEGTGVSVVQVPGGVEWNPGETVRLVVGIAAASDEHLQILANLTRLLADEEGIEVLATTDDPAVVVERLTRAEAASRPPPEPVDVDGFAAVDVVLAGASGLHARPATHLVEVAQRFDAEVRVRAGEQVVPATSLASLLSLGAGSGTTLTLLARGPQAVEALEVLRGEVAAGLGEDEEDEDEGAPELEAPGWEPSGAAIAVEGLGASRGIAVAPLWHLKQRQVRVLPTGGLPHEEDRRLTRALASARAELEELHDDVAARSGRSRAAIFRAHQAFLDDTEMVDSARRGIAGGAAAGWAWRAAVADRVGQLQKVDDPLLASRAVDLADVGERVLAVLAEVEEGDAVLPDHPVVLVAEDLTPSDTALIDPARVVGFATAVGGPTSHTSIIARALGIPAVVGAGPAVLSVPAGETVVLDGFSGTLWSGLGADDLASAEAAHRDLDAVRAAEHRTRFEPAILTDGARVEVVANVNRPAEAAAAVEAGAEGVGLMRTEFLYLDRSAPPGEEEQEAVITAMVEALNGLPLIVRTLDIGGDKEAPYLDLPPEDNSFLGLRGIRLCLARPELFGAQLRAVYRASQRGPLSIMFPMVARMEDLDAALAHAEEARRAVGADPVDVGIMIEVPSAVAMAPELARRVQFFSIGTNDLTQYVLAMDRLHPVLARQADALHPAVLRMVRATVEAADAAGIWVGVCGGVAGEPEGALILTGLGVRELSVSVPSVAAVKARLRRVAGSDLRALAERALACSTATQVRELELP
jgi:multiphosphoryl transfer protein